MLTAIRFGRALWLAPLVGEERRFYDRPWTPVELQAWQLDRFNAQWGQLAASVPYFAALRRERRLPQRFASWDEVRLLLPTMDRGLIQQEARALTRPGVPPASWQTTGGSTAQPVRIPFWKSETRVSAADHWYARSWYGVSPKDRLFLLWGHNYALGRGVRGWIRTVTRGLKDAALGYSRHSAYDLSEMALRRAGEELLACRAAYVLGYSVALDRFARINEDRVEAFHCLGLKVAIGTAEAFPQSDSASIIGRVLGCPVAMEYGAVETGPIAHETSAGTFAVFWRHWHLEGIESPEMPGMYELVVTSLYARCLPLVRYRLGDLVRPNPSEPDFPQQLDRIVGRCNDYVVVDGGRVIHAQAFIHVVKDIAAIRGFQVLQSPTGDITLRYDALGDLAGEDVKEIRRRLQLVDQALERVSLLRVSALQQTVAGKTRSVVRMVHGVAHQQERS